MAGMALEEEEGAAAGLVEEEEEDEEEDGICVGWAAATSAALTLGSRRQKEGGLALCKRPRSRPVLCGPPGAESGQRLRRTRPVWGCSGCITLQLAPGCCAAETHKHMAEGLGIALCVKPAQPHQRKRTQVQSKYSPLQQNTTCARRLLDLFQTNSVDVK